MTMPPCGTFQYSGVIPTDWPHPQEVWKLQDQSGAKPGKTANPMLHNRLVGLEPILEISDGRLLLTASDLHRAEVRSAALEFDPALAAVLRGGDILSLCRTDTANFGLSLVRAGRLLFAVGAVTQVPTGEVFAIRGGGPRRENVTLEFLIAPPKDNWVDVTISGEARRLLTGEEAVIRGYRISVLRCFEEGLPGRYECLAISLEGTCPHEAALHLATVLAEPNGGLKMILGKKS